MIEGLRARIIEKAAQYFPSEAANPVEVRITPASVRSTNKVFVVEIVFKGSGAARRAIAKMTPDEESEQGAVREYEMLKRLYDNEELLISSTALPGAHVTILCGVWATILTLKILATPRRCHSIRITVMIAYSAPSSRMK